MIASNIVSKLDKNSNLLTLMCLIDVKSVQ